MFSRWEKIDILIAVLFVLTNLSYILFRPAFTYLLWGLIIVVVIRLIFLIKKKLFWRVRNRLVFSGLFLIATPIFFLSIFFYIVLSLVMAQYSIAILDNMIARKQVEIEQVAEYYLKLNPEFREKKVRRWLKKSTDSKFVAFFDKDPESGEFRKTYNWPPAFDTGPVTLEEFSGYFMLRDELYLGAMKKVEDAAVLVAHEVNPEFLSRLDNISEFRIIFPKPNVNKSEEIKQLRNDIEAMDDELAIPIPWVYQYSYRNYNQLSEGRPKQAAGHFWLFLDISKLYKKISAVSAGSIAELAKKVIYLLIVLFGTFIIISFVIGLRSILVITRSIHLIGQGTRRIRNGDFSFRIKTRSGDELQDLGESFNEMAAGIDRLLIEEKEKQRLEEELRIARSIQLKLLPPDYFETDMFELAAINIPATEIAGDYFDYYLKEGDYMNLLVADVSGKGASAAFYMAELKGVINHLQREDLNPAHVISECHYSLSPSFDRVTFITMNMAKVLLPEKKFILARAGHTPALYYSKEKKDCIELFPKGVAIGLMNFDGKKIQELEVSYQPGDILFLFSDGLSEVMNDEDEILGVDNIKRIIRKNSHLPAKEIKQKLLDFSIEFSQTGMTRDDLTFIILKVK